MRAAELVTNTSAEHTGAYNQQLRDIVVSLTGGCELMPSIPSWLIWLCSTNNRGGAGHNGPNVARDGLFEVPDDAYPRRVRRIRVR